MEPTIPYNPAPPVNPLDQQARILAIKNLMGQGQMQQQNIQAGNLENQQRQMDLDSQQALQKAYMEANGDPDKTTQLAAKYGAKPQALLQWQSSVLDQKMKTLDLVSKQGSIAKDQADAMQGAHDAVSQAPAANKPVVYQQQLMGLKQRGIDVSQLPPQYPGDQQFALMGATVKTHSQMVEEALKTSETQKNTAQGQDATVAAQQKQAVLAGTNAQGMTAEQQATTKQGQQRVGLEFQRLQEEKRHNQATEGSLTPEALTMAAQQYAQTGVMPALGRTAGMRSQIMNEAARAYPKLDIATNAAAYKANEDSLKKLQSSFDQVSAFESTANKNLDLFLEQAKKVVDSGVPLINTPLRNISKQMGGVNAPAYDTARQVAVNEIAKVTSNPGLSGQLTDSARKEVSDYNPESATLAQTYHVAEILRKDMSNRHDSYAQQIADIKQRLGQAPGTSSTSAQPSGTIYARDPQGKLHQAPAGTALPAGWKQENR